MEPSALPAVPREWAHTMTLDEEPVLELSIRRPSFPEEGKTGRLERYFAQAAAQWKDRWEQVLFPRACQALARAREDSRPFTPWRAGLDYTVTLWQPPLLSLRLDAFESGAGPRPLRVCTGETWDCAKGYPRTLRSFFPAKPRRWRGKLLRALQAQAGQQLASGESLLDPGCAQAMARSFAPDRFYLTGEGLAVFYPLYLLGPYVEGIPVFTVPLAE